MADQHKVLKDADGRVVDYAFGPVGFATPPRLTTKLANLPAGASIETFAGDLPTNISEGLAIDTAGMVSVPTTEITNELLEARRDKIGIWVIENGATAGFLHYARFQSNPRARAYEAVQRMAYLHTHSNEMLSNDTWWGKLNSLTAISWQQFVLNMTHNADGWEVNATMNGLRAGNTWRLVEVDAGTGRYTLVADPAGSPPYTYNSSHYAAYLELVASAKAG